jgi:hypothetical protein
VSRDGPSAHIESMESQQLTLSGLVETLDAIPLYTPLYISGFGSANRLSGRVFRHRPFVDGVKLEPRMKAGDYTATAGAFAAYLRRSAFGLKWLTEDSADDEFPTSSDTPVWVCAPYEVSFHAVTGVELVKGFAVIRTTDMAPVQGPSLQRVTDDEAINRMRVENLQRTGEDTVFAPHVERFLLNMLPDERSRVLLDLAEARQELASFEASLQAKKDRVAKLEHDAVRNDYLLGIRDDLPGTGPERGNGGLK